MIVVRTLGAAEIAVGDHLLKPTSTKKFALLLYLAAERGRHTTRAVLQDLLFPELPERNARHALRELVYQLRQLGAPIEGDNDGVGLPSEAVRSDYSEVMAAERLSDDQVRAVEGGFLPGYAPGHSESYTEWIDGHRAQVVSNICRRVTMELVAAAKHSTRREQVARACLALDPINEKATRVLAESLLVGGCRAEANALLAKYRTEVGRALFVQSTVSETWTAPMEAQADCCRFLGREIELQAMLDRLDLVASGQSRTLAIVGAAGIGKSRLLREFSEIVRFRGFTMIRARCCPSDVGRPLSILTDLLPQLIESPGALGCSPGSLDQLRSVATGRGEYANDRAEDGKEDRFFASIRELIEAVTDESPLVVLLDDLHWMDEVSLRFLADILGSNISRLLLVVATRNTRKLSAVITHDHAALIHLGALSEEAARAMIRAGLAGGNVETERWICEACAGNPLYVELLVAQARSNSDARGLPPAMLDAIDSNICKLPKETRAVLLYSALLGRHVSVDRLLALTSRGSLELTIALDELVRSGLIPDIATSAPQPHRLVADRVGYAVSQPARISATRSVAQLLAEDAGQSGAALAWDAAHLWIAAGEPDRASYLIETCASQALQLGRAREASLLLRDASRVGSPTDRSRLLVRAAHVAAQSNELDLVLQLCSDLRTSGENLLPSELAIAELHARLCWGHDSSALAELQHFTYSAPTKALRRQAAFELLRVADAQRDRALSEAAFAELTPWVESADCDPESRLRILIAYHTSFGDEEIAKGLALDALQISESMQPYAAAQMKRLAGVALLRAGAVESAISAWTTAFDAAAHGRSTRSQFEAAVMLAATTWDIGDTERSGKWEQIANELIAQLPELGRTLFWLVYQSDRAAYRDDIDALMDCRRHFIDCVSRPMCRRANRWLRALDAHIDVFRKPHSHYDRTIRSLLREHTPGEETGDASDFEMSAVVRLYLQHGEVDRARKALDEYLKDVRVRRAPLWSSLRQAAERAGRFDVHASPVAGPLPIKGRRPE